MCTCDDGSINCADTNACANPQCGDDMMIMAAYELVGDEDAVVELVGYVNVGAEMDAMDVSAGKVTVTDALSPATMIGLRGAAVMASVALILIIGCHAMYCQPRKEEKYQPIKDETA